MSRRPKAFEEWDRIPDIIPTHICRIPPFRHSIKFGKITPEAIARLRNPPPEPEPVLKPAVISQIQKFRHIAGEKVFVIPGSWRLGSMIADDIIRAEIAPIADTRIGFGNFHYKDGIIRPLLGRDLGYTGQLLDTGDWISVINPAFGAGPASWGVLHEIKHLLDLYAGADLQDQSKFDFGDNLSYNAYAALAEEQRAQDYACAHMMRLGYTGGKKMSCEDLLSRLMFMETPL